MNDHTQKSDKDFTETMALGEAGKNPEMAARTASYLDEQIALAKAQQGHIKTQQAQLEREASLHDLHAENLKLQSHALRAQHKQLHTQRLHDRLRSVYQGVLSLIALAVLGIIGYAVYSAATDQSVVVNQFQVPPSFVAQGNSGAVVASAFLDQLQALQTDTHTSQVARNLQDTWSNNIRLQVPDVHISLGDISRTLHNWLGHEIQINGDVVQQGKQIALTVRGTGLAAKTFTAVPNALPTLLTQAAEYVYGQAEPYLFGAYLERHGRNTEALALVQTAYISASAREKPWLLHEWANALANLNQYTEAADKDREAVRLDPNFWLAGFGLGFWQQQLGEEEAAYQAGVSMEHLAHRGFGYATLVPGLGYAHLDTLRMDLPAVHHEYLADEAAHGGVGVTVADAIFDAQILARMHADRQSEFTLNTAPGAGNNHYVIFQTHYVQGLMALDQQSYPQAAADLEMVGTLSTQFPTWRVNYISNPSCYLGLAEEMTGHSNKADAAIANGGHFVDCYRFKGDIADHRGNWTQAQQDYQTAVNLAPSLPQAYQSWGMALLRHKDYQGAIEKFQEANQRGPHWCDPLKYWGEALVAQGNYKEAIEKYADASKYTPGWGALELAWGQALDKTGDHKEALTHYQSAKNNGESLTAAEQMTLTKLLM
ncbi:MAG: tetratricopeptide repeat protein [Gammaproteobacteria bacterium]